MSDLPFPDSATTQELLSACARGSRSAYNELFQSHRRGLTQFIEARIDPAISPRVDASDIVQETQTVMFSRLDDFLQRRPMGFHTWAIKTAFDCLAKARRTHVLTAKRSVLGEARLTDKSSIAFTQQLFLAAPDERQRLDREETIQVVRQALAALDEIDRELFHMRYVEGLSNQAIGEILELTTSAVSKRHGRAIRRLHGALAECWEE
ncbi:MAG: sigma-70 family RNA polymerase sigma factor [Planctomycetales bacterium]|nr:sigma-70 family RNA polymerase sigma factor [Planctomycetales bacterium]